MLKKHTVQAGTQVCASLKLKVRRGGSRSKPVIEAKLWESQSADGTWAQNEQVVNRELEPMRYRKRVVLEDGTVVKDVDGPIDEGHGDPRKR